MRDKERNKDRVLIFFVFVHHQHKYSFRLAYILGTAGSDLMSHHVLYLLTEQLQAGTHIGNSW